MANERETERIIRTHFEQYENKGQLKIEEQASTNQDISSALSKATKKGTGKGVGKPEFIITFPGYKKVVLIVEAKANTNRHESPSRDKPMDYAVDGAIHYSKFLAEYFNVISIAVSGTELAELKVSHYLQLQGTSKPKPKFAKQNELLDFDSYMTAVEHEQVEQDYEKISRYYKQLNDKLHDYKIRSADRALLVSCILVALRQKEFVDDYKKYPEPEELIGFLLENAKKDFAGIDKIEVVEESFGFVKTQEYLLKKDVLQGLIEEIQDKIDNFIKTNRFYDAVSELYVEFLRYSNADKRLGIVLTPAHIADFASELVEINKNSVVLDTCCGTGTFLVAAMKKMISDADGNVKLENEIKKDRVLGIEFQAYIYSLACSNMFIHGDGKSSILKGDCFQADNPHRRNKRINAGLLNPPFDNKSDNEFEYLLESLEYLQPNSLCACVLPMKCTLSKPKMVDYRERLMRDHSVLAVFSMPSDLFHNSGVSVQTSIFLVEAHKPHKEDSKIFLAFCDDDGFVKTGDKGRVDSRGKWAGIKNRWLSIYKDKKEENHFSVLKSLKPKDVFCAEAYITTDYGQLSKHYFERILKLHIAYRIIEDEEFTPRRDSVIDTEMKLDIDNWEYRTFKEIFGGIQRGNFPSNPDLLDAETHEKNKTILIGASQNHNGSNSEYVLDEPSYYGGYITVGNGGDTGCGQAFYQAVAFNAKSTANLLKLKEIDPDPFVSLFLVGLIRLERFRYNFGRGWGLKAMEESEILVPVKDGKIDYGFMGDYIKHLPHSASLMEE